MAINALLLHSQLDVPVVGELRSVAQQVEERLSHFGEVRPHRRERRVDLDVQPVVVRLNERLDGGHDVVDHGWDLEALEVDFHLAGLDLREIEHIVDER